MSTKSKEGMLDLIGKLLAVASTELPHIFNGMCPDRVEGSHTRDTDCPACQVLIEADALLPKQPAGRAA